MLSKATFSINITYLSKIHNFQRYVSDNTAFFLRPQKLVRILFTEQNCRRVMIFFSLIIIELWIQQSESLLAYTLARFYKNHKNLLICNDDPSIICYKMLVLSLHTDSSYMGLSLIAVANII